MLPEVWEASKPGDLMREWRTRAVAKPTIRFRKSAGTCGWHQGCRPFAAFATPHFSGLAPNVTFGSGVGTGRPGFGVRNREARHPDQRSHPSLGPMDLPGPSACVGRDPLSHKAKGVLTGARVTNDIDPLGRKAGDLVVRGWPSAASRLLLRVPWQLRARQRSGAARGSGGFQACRKRP